MSHYIYVDGPAKLYLGAANCSATSPPETESSGVYSLDTTGLTELGITESGVQVSINTLTHRVNSDDCGGSEGNPAEMIVMGATGTIRGTIVKYNSAAWADLISGLHGAVTEGRVPLPGTGLFSNGYGFGLVVQGLNVGYYFPKCELASNPREFNISTTERKTSFTITAYPIIVSSAYKLYFPMHGSVNSFDACTTAYSAGS